MKIAVCIKRVPSTEMTVRIGSDGKSIDPSGVEFIISPFDEMALEEGLRVKEKSGSGEVIAVTVGPTEAAPTLRTALAMGADRAILVKDEQAYQRDTFAIASGLASVLKELSPDIIFFGKQAVDDDNSQVGTMVANILDLPFVSLIVTLDLSGKTALVQREGESGKEILEVTLPAIFTAQKGLNEPRYPSLKGIMSAKKKPLEEKTYNFPPNSIETVKMEYPPSRTGGRIVGKGAEAVPELVRLLKEEAKIL